MPEQTNAEPKFELGEVVITSNALETLPTLDVFMALFLHHHGDWGLVCKEDWQANEDALIEGGRLFSVYQTEAGQKFYIITEWDRSATTVLLPEDY